MARKLPTSTLPRDLAAWAAVSVLLLVYILSMCRDLYWYDSAELALAAVQPGLSHPPGQPLHTLVGHVMARLFPDHPLLALNLLSALCAALTAVPAMRIVRHLDPAGRSRPAWLGSAVLVGLGLGNAVWDSATRIEVYAPAALLALAQIAHLLGTIEALNSPEQNGKLPSRLFVQGLLLGLVFSIHPYVAVFLAVATVISLAQPLTRTRVHRPGLAAVLLAGGGLLGLLPYVYVPASTLIPGSLVWGDPSTWRNMLFYFSGADYSANRAPFLTAVAQSFHFLGWMGSNGMLAILVAGLACWWLGWRAHPSPGTGARLAPLIILVLTLAVIGRIANYRPDIPDLMGYLLPVTWLAGAALASAAERAHRTLVLDTRRYLVLAIIVAWVAANAFMPPSLPSRSRADNRLARRIAASYLMDAPRGAIIVAGSDHVVFPLLYLTEHEHLRPDVIVLPTGWASSSWFWARLHRSHPDLASIDLEASDRSTRIRRFLAANPGRPVIAETLHMASLASGPIVRSGWTLRSGAGSGRIDRVVEGSRHDFARSRLHAWLQTRGNPGTQDRRILSFIATQWGRDERSGGHPGQAVLDHLSGSPPVTVELPRNLMDPSAWPPEVPEPPPPGRFTLLSLPTHNLLCAGHILFHHASGQDAAIRLVRQAASLGSSRARRWLAERSIPPGEP